ncbi:MAG: U32 family peptidase [Melioribacteraceae bacterium]|nr:U32 family peptidase [Melioribacteraceae bacterium]
MTKIKLELLSPAKDLQTGIAAIDCGADAVYIGAPSFGAREAAGNPIEDIHQLVNYAHKFWAKVYVTVNTIIFDEEIETVQKLINQLYEIGVDAVIFQDMALLKMNIPLIQLYASTQTHNYEIERIKLLDELGIKRIILARELTIDEIKKIKNEVKAELEFFIHGALCVSLSGQCYMSYDFSGRSANRGECAQNCRLPYTLIDANNNILIKDKHLLSLKDLNLSHYINDLIDAGITSFKIEGRLKDISYVKNITAFYRQLIDDIIKNKPQYEKSSSGYSIIPFQPDPEKTFNRGYTNYFINDRSEKVSSHETPKSKGKYLGKVIEIDKSGFRIGTNEKIYNGDGICFLDSKENLVGFNVNKVDGNKILSKELYGLKPGTKIYRNFDYAFNKELEKDCKRKIDVEFEIFETENGIRIESKDEDEIKVSKTFETEKLIAKNALQAIETLKNNLSKSGSTIFNVNNIIIHLSQTYFFTTKQINEWRRILLEELEKERTLNHKREIFEKRKTKISIDHELDYKANVVNSLSKKFYEELGVKEIEPGFELQKIHYGKTVMTCKYCIKDELNLCPFDTDKKVNEPLYLVHENKKYELVFNCKECLMEIISR